MHLADEAQWEQELADHIADPTLARAARGEQVDASALDPSPWWVTWRLVPILLVLLGAGFAGGWYLP